MKKTLLFAGIALFLAACNNNANENDTTQASDSTTVAEATGSFGASIDENGAIGMDSLIAMVNAGQTAIDTVKVSGTIGECCQAKGCWMSVDRGDGSSMRVTFKDYGFFVPKNCAGKTAVMLGRAYMDTTSVEDLRHFAEDGGASKDSIAKIVSPKLELAFEAEGVIIK